MKRVYDRVDSSRDFAIGNVCIYLTDKSKYLMACKTKRMSDASKRIIHPHPRKRGSDENNARFLETVVVMNKQNAMRVHPHVSAIIDNTRMINVICEDIM